MGADAARRLGRIVKRGIVSNWRLYLYLVLLMAMMNFSSHGTQDLYPTFLEKSHGYSPQRRAMLNAFSMVGAVSGGILFGFLSDRIGRRRAMVIALVLACCVVPMWAFAKTAAVLWMGGFLIQFMVQGAWGLSRRISRSCRRIRCADFCRGSRINAEC